MADYSSVSDMKLKTDNKLNEVDENSETSAKWYNRTQKSPSEIEQKLKKKLMLLELESTEAINWN